MCIYIYIYICSASCCVAGWPEAFATRTPEKRGRSRLDRFGLDAVRYFGLILLRSSGPKTHAGPSLLFRKRFGLDWFDNISVSI